MLDCNCRALRRNFVVDFSFPRELMGLPPQVLQRYVDHFRKVRVEAGPSLSEVLRHYGESSDALWLLLNRVVDWRNRANDQLHVADRYVTAFWGVRCDAQNGGFSQYFSNSAGDFWPDLVELLVLGEDEVGEAHFRRMLAFFPNSSPSTDRDTRNEQLCRIESVDERWDAPFNAEYYRDVFYPSDATLLRALNKLNDPEYVPDPDHISLG